MTMGRVSGECSVFRIMSEFDVDSSRRWLVHSIASYYGLSTWSITVGDPARREAYVGIPTHQGSGRPPSPILRVRPLWGMV